jgi:hypothetical protein
MQEIFAVKDSVLPERSDLPAAAPAKKEVF